VSVFWLATATLLASLAFGNGFTRPNTFAASLSGATSQLPARSLQFSAGVSFLRLIVNLMESYEEISSV
jgi:hypothetical protein